MEEHRYDLFLSYSTEDSSLANELHEAFEKQGLAVFMAEKDIPTAALWEENIRNAIHLSKRVLLLITPRSKNRTWVLLEAGAAWALQKDLIPALVYVKPEELIDPVRRYQARTIETSEQRIALIREITSIDSINQAQIAGRWLDKMDKDMVFFQQKGNKVIGIYDFGSRRKVACYIGSIKGRTFEYEFKWFNGSHRGHGQMILFDDNDKLSGRWWHGDEKMNAVEHVGYDRIDSEMPDWLSEDDFKELWKLHLDTI